MSEWDTESLVAADKKYVWHPFTNMGAWCDPDHEPIVLVEGRGALLWDSRGREYIDGNSSIWTNIHGHNHPHINAAIRRQLDRVAHTSFLGFTNPPAIELARRIVELFPENTLTRVFFSDDGSTGMEAAIRIVQQYWKLSGKPERRVFVTFTSAYHGDTLGAASLGASTMFGSCDETNFPVRRVLSVDELDSFTDAQKREVAAVVVEPAIQGAAGMKLWSPGILDRVRTWTNDAGTHLIADEVLTGFGRTGKMFACQHDSVIPDLVVLGKALTGGYLPCAFTLVREEVFSQFASNLCKEGTLFYGHSYTGNALACAAANASLDVFEQEGVLEKLQAKIEQLRVLLAKLRSLPQVFEIRQCGFIAGIELHPHETRKELGAVVCVAARKHGLLTRPIRNVVVLMPPFCITPAQLSQAVEAIRLATLEVCPAG